MSTAVDAPQRRDHGKVKKGFPRGGGDEEPSGQA